MESDLVTGYRGGAGRSSKVGVPDSADTGEEINVAVLPRQDKGRGVVIGVTSSQRFQIFRREMLDKQREQDPE